jgi:cytoskeletal protein RodZ
VVVVVVVLLLAGTHTVKPTHHPAATGHPKSHTAHRRATTATTTSTTVAPPVVSAPSATSANAATYSVGPASYTLVLSATTSDCWVDATNGSTGAVLYTGVLNPGQTQTVSASGPVSVVAGAPNAFGATVNGTAITLPAGFQAPFTLHFVAAV